MAMLDFENLDSLDNDRDENKYLDICKNGSIIEAVKAYMDDSGCGLAEAKAYVDNLCAKYGFEPSHNSSSGQGCMFIMSILIIFTSLIFL